MHSAVPARHLLTLTVVSATLAVLMLGCLAAAAPLIQGALYPGATVTYFKPLTSAACVHYAPASSLTGSFCGAGITMSIIMTSQAPPAQVFAWYTNKYWQFRLGHLSFQAGAEINERANPLPPPTYPLVIGLDITLDGLP